MDPTRSRRKGIRRLLIIIAGVVVVAAAFAVLKPWTRFGAGSDAARADTSKADSAAAGSDSAKAESGEEVKIVPVEVALVVRDTLASTYAASATLEAERHVDLLAKVVGTVREIRVEEGRDVAEGDVLAVLDMRELQIQQQKMKSSLDNAQAEHERIQALASRELTSVRELENARNLLDQARANLDDAELRLSYAEIRAPFGGKVTRRLIDVGQTVNPGMQIFSLADMNPLLVRVFLPEEDVLNIRPGQKVEARLDADPDVQLSGRVRQVAPVVDRQTGTVKVTIEVAELALAVRPGSFVRVFITTDVHPMALVLPKRCLVEETSRRFVYVVQGDSVVARNVELGYEEADRVEIAGGLAEGDPVVLVGQGSLREGSRVRVLKSASEQEKEKEKDTAEVSS
jgi:membrane fusion protein (multidrug efflux system)